MADIILPVLFSKRKQKIFGIGSVITYNRAETRDCIKGLGRIRRFRLIGYNLKSQIYECVSLTEEVGIVFHITKDALEDGPFYLICVT